MRRLVALMMVTVGIAGLGVVSGSSNAWALSLSGSYFRLNGALTLDPHPDTSTLNGTIDHAVVLGLVNSALSGGLPVYSGSPAPFSGAITDVDGGNVIQWWTEHSTTVTKENFGGGVNTRVDSGVGNSFLPASFGNNAFYAEGQSDNDTFYRAVHWTGSFTALGSVVLTIGADDDAWLFLKGGPYADFTLVVDNGGVKPVTAASPAVIPAGTYQLALFFADRHTSESAITFTCDAVNGGGGCIAPVPEPATLLLFGTTLAGLGAVVRRRMKKGYLAAKD
jgi:hypothetical protein